MPTHLLCLTQSFIVCVKMGPCLFLQPGSLLMCAGMGLAHHNLMVELKCCWVGPEAVAQTARLHDC